MEIDDADSENQADQDHVFLRSLISKFKQQQLEKQQRLEQESRTLEQKNAQEQQQQAKAEATDNHHHHHESEERSRKSSTSAGSATARSDGEIGGQIEAAMSTSHLESAMHFMNSVTTNGPSMRQQGAISNKLPSTIKLAPPTHSILRLSPSSNSSTTAQAHLIKNTRCLTPTTPSTIVKLNTQPPPPAPSSSHQQQHMSFKATTSPSSAPAYSLVTFPSGSVQSSPGLPLKQIVLPKPSQKLFFLPPAGQSSQPTNRAQNVSTFVPSSNVAPTTTLSLLPTTPATSQPPAKLIVYKASPTVTTLTTTGSVNDKSAMNNVIMNGTPKNLKILTTTTSTMPNASPSTLISLSNADPTSLLNKQIIRSLAPVSSQAPTTLVHKLPAAQISLVQSTLSKSLEASAGDSSQSSTSPSVSSQAMTSPASPSSSSSLLNGSSPPEIASTQTM